MAEVVVLIGCVSGKQDRPARARDLYTSPLFLRRRMYAERSTHPWAILSALHGLLLPDDFVRPYNVALDSLTAAERAIWGRKVRASFAARWPSCWQVEIHAGRVYVDAFGEPEGVDVSAPLRGLSLGRQLAWYNDRLRLQR